MTRQQLKRRSAPARTLRLAKTVAAQARRHDLAYLSAGLAFYSFRALIPSALLIVLTYGLIAEPATAVRHIRQLAGTVSSDLGQTVSRIVAQLAFDTGERKGFGVLISLGVALYAGVRGARALTNALDTLHETHCKRSFRRALAVSLGIVCVAILTATAGLIAIVVLGYLEKAVAGIAAGLAFVIKRENGWCCAIASLGISALYRYAKCFPHARRQV